MARLAAATLLLLSPAAARGEEPPEPAPCEVFAYLSGNDAGQQAVYDGIRRGLEEANLPRVCRREVPQDEAGWRAALAEIAREPRPVAFAVGASAIARCGAALRALPPASRPPCVYVDSAIAGERETFPAAPKVEPPAAVVRAEVPLSRWREVVRALFPGKERPRLVLPDAGASDAGLLAAAERILGADVLPAAEPGCDAALDWPLATGEPRPFPEGLPVLSADRGRFGRGAAVVLAPDHARLGRLAADAARRLREGEGVDRPLHVSLRSSELWVDLGAADRSGLSPPLPFLASADRLRRAGAPVAEAGEPSR